jgi:hypothetical protein
MTEPASHTIAYLRRIDEKIDRLGSELRTDVGERLGWIEDELLVLNGIVLRREGRDVELRGSRRSSTATSGDWPRSGAGSPSSRTP